MMASSLSLRARGVLAVAIALSALGGLVLWLWRLFSCCGTVYLLAEVLVMVSQPPLAYSFRASCWVLWLQG
jgi:hypothetical protein